MNCLIVMHIGQVHDWHINCRWPFVCHRNAYRIKDRGSTTNCLIGIKQRMQFIALDFISSHSLSHPTHQNIFRHLGNGNGESVPPTPSSRTKIHTAHRLRWIWTRTSNTINPPLTTNLEDNGPTFSSLWSVIAQSAALIGLFTRSLHGGMGVGATPACHGEGGGSAGPRRMTSTCHLPDSGPPSFHCRSQAFGSCGGSDDASNGISEAHTHRSIYRTAGRRELSSSCPSNSSCFPCPQCYLATNGHAAACSSHRITIPTIQQRLIFFLFLES